MIGVKFNRAMRPYGEGDTALLPDDVAKRLIRGGDAEQHKFPRSLHGAEASKQAYQTKGVAK